MRPGRSAAWSGTRPVCQPVAPGFERSARPPVRGAPIGYVPDMDTLPLAFANGWASGLSAYATLFIAGMLGRAGIADTPAALQRTDVLAVVGLLVALEFVTDKIPYVDSIWDSVHTVVRPVIAGVLGALIAGDAGTLEQAIAVTTS